VGEKGNTKEETDGSLLGPMTAEDVGISVPQHVLEEMEGRGRPRTQERPGTGAKDPKPLRPRERASGQITDETGEYGPVQYSDPDAPTDRNRI
jgi:hypothetical protein